MRILIGCPLSPEAVSGPSTVARELTQSFDELGDTVTIITFTSLERALPLPLRHIVFFIRAFPSVLFTHTVLLLDPASTGPSLALLARLLGRACVVRVGGDFLWESYVERTKDPVLLSEFYTAPRTLTLRERLIQRATRLTLSLADSVAYTTEWQRTLWATPYGIPQERAVVIAPALPERTPTPPTGPVFLCAHRGMRIKNGAIMQRVWELVSAEHPEAVLDASVRTPERYREALKDCLAVIVPSLSEVSPNAAIEAMRFGKPFIATKDTGVYEELKDAGIFVDTRSPENVARAVSTLLTPEGYADAVRRLASYTTVRTWRDITKAFRAELVRHR